MGSGSGSDAPAPVRTIEDVAKEDAAYRARDAETPAPAPEREAAEMKTLLSDEEAREVSTSLSHCSLLKPSCTFHDATVCYIVSLRHQYRLTP